MYELLSRSAGRPWGAPGRALVAAPNDTVTRPLILHMQENRSHLSNDARTCFAAIAILFMVGSIAPALHGQWLVPVFSILAMAGLTFALERHGKSRPASEVLELGNGRVRHHDSQGRRVEFPVFWMRLAAEGKGPADLRLFLRGRDGEVEIGRCLSLDERREVAPLVAAALAQART
jgi:uncharacterized membrane protein